MDYLPLNSFGNAKQDALSRQTVDWKSLTNEIPVVCIESCSADYTIPATANIYFAGSAASASLQYNFSNGNNTDLASMTSPVELKPTYGVCLSAGTLLSFKNTGNSSQGGGNAGAKSPEVTGQIGNHVLGGVLGKSDVFAPMVSMVGVFIGPNDPENTAPPSALDFSSPAARNFTILKPQLGQVFFVGDGKTDSGEIQKFEVPIGASRLYLGVWDIGQWNNNSGFLNGAIKLFH